MQKAIRAYLYKDYISQGYKLSCIGHAISYTNLGLMVADKIAQENVDVR